MTQAPRNSAGQFLPGQSGNPTGRPKSTAFIVDEEGKRLPFDRFMDMNGDLVVAQLLKTILDKNTSDGPRVTAIKTYLEYWKGKPTAQIVLKDIATDAEEVYDLKALSKETLIEIVDATIRKVA